MRLEDFVVRRGSGLRVPLQALFGFDFGAGGHRCRQKKPTVLNPDALKCSGT